MDKCRRSHGSRRKGYSGGVGGGWGAHIIGSGVEKINSTGVVTCDGWVGGSSIEVHHLFSEVPLNPTADFFEKKKIADRMDHPVA